MIRKALGFLASVPGLVLIGIARAWQLGPSRVMPPTCRYSPSCSQYAIEAVRRHGAIKGGWLAFWRLLRCQPWGGYGYDPVPEKKHGAAGNADAGNEDKDGCGCG